MTTSVEQICRCLRVEGGVLTTRMQEFGRNRGLSIGVSLGAEHFFREIRRKERDGTNPFISSKTVWSQVIETRVLHDIHRYAEFPWVYIEVPSAEQKLDANCFAAKAHNSSIAFDSLKGTNQTPKWYTCNTTSNMIPHMDFEVAEHCDAVGGWSCASKTFFGCLLHESLAFRKNGSFDDSWFLSLGLCGHAVVIAWPLRFTLFHHDGVDHSLYWPVTLDVLSKLEFVCVTDVDQVEVVQLEWLSPAVQLLKFGVKCVAGSGFVMRGVCEPSGLMSVAAANGFWDLTKMQLQKLASHFGSDQGAGSLFAILKRFGCEICGRWRGRFVNH